MQVITTYFNDLATDIRCAIQDADSSKTDREVRIISIATRVLGGFCIVSGVFGIAQVLSAGVLSPHHLIVPVLDLTLGHDFVQMGYNLRKVYLVINSLTDSDQNLIRGISNFVSGLFQLGAAAVEEDLRGTPFIVHNTIIFEPVYRLFGRQQ